MCQETLPPPGDIIGAEDFPPRARPTCIGTSLREATCSLSADARSCATGATEALGTVRGNGHTITSARTYWALSVYTVFRELDTSLSLPSHNDCDLFLRCISQTGVLRHPGWHLPQVTEPECGRAELPPQAGHRVSFKDPQTLLPSSRRAGGPQAFALLYKAGPLPFCLGQSRVGREHEESRPEARTLLLRPSAAPASPSVPQSATCHLSIAEQLCPEASGGGAGMGMGSPHGKEAPGGEERQLGWRPLVGFYAEAASLQPRGTAGRSSLPHPRGPSFPICRAQPTPLLPPSWKASTMSLVPAPHDERTPGKPPPREAPPGLWAVSSAHNWSIAQKAPSPHLFSGLTTLRLTLQRRGVRPSQPGAPMAATLKTSGFSSKPKQPL